MKRNIKSITIFSLVGFFIVASTLIISNKLHAQTSTIDQGTTIDAPVFQDQDATKDGSISGGVHSDYDWGDDDPGGPGGGNPPIDDVPFDGGVGMLLALGIIGGYSASKKKVI